MIKYILSHFTPLVVCAGIIIAGAGCSSSRKTTVTTTENQVTSTPAPDKVPAQSFSIVSQLAETYNSWNDFEAPLSVNLAQPVNFGISGRATMVRNESIHISMRMLGLEVAVAHIDNDSAWVVDKFHRYICSVPTSTITGNNGFSIGDLQDMMLGRAFYPGKGTLTPSPQTNILFSVNERNDSTILLPRRIPSDAPWMFILAPGPQLSTIEVSLPGDKGFSLNYSDIIETIAGATAQRIEASGNAGKLNIMAAIKWNMNKAKWNSGVNNSWEAPSGYKQISASSLIKALKQ